MTTLAKLLVPAAPPATRSAMAEIEALDAALDDMLPDEMRARAEGLLDPLESYPECLGCGSPLPFAELQNRDVDGWPDCLRCQRERREAQAEDKADRDREDWALGLLDRWEDA